VKGRWRGLNVLLGHLSGDIDSYSSRDGDEFSACHGTNAGQDSSQVLTRSHAGRMTQRVFSVAGFSICFKGQAVLDFKKGGPVG